MMKHPVTQKADFVEPSGQVFSGTHFSRHVRETGFNERRPECLLVTFVQQADPEPKIQLCNDPPGFQRFIFVE